MRIRFLSDQIYENGGAGNGPRFAKGQVLDESGVKKALGLADEPTDEFKRAFLHRWLQRGVAEETDGRAKVTEPDLIEDETADEGDEVDELDLHTLTRAELDALATERGVDISEAKNKGDVIAALELAAEAK